MGDGILYRYARIPVRQEGSPARCQSECEGFTVPSQVGKIPRHDVTHVDTPEISCAKRPCEIAGLLVVHVFGNVEPRWKERIHEKKIHSSECLFCLFREIGDCVRSVSDTDTIAFQQNPTGENRRMDDRKEGYGYSVEFERAMFPYSVPPKIKEPEDFPAVLHNLFRCVHIRDLLNPVKFTKAHEMIIMAVGPEDCIDMGGSRMEELLAKIGACVDENILPARLDQKGGPEPLQAILLRMNALVARAPDPGSTDGITRSEQDDFHPMTTSSGRE